MPQSQLQDWRQLGRSRQEEIQCQDPPSFEDLEEPVQPEPDQQSNRQKQRSYLADEWDDNSSATEEEDDQSEDVLFHSHRIVKLANLKVSFYD